MSGPGFDALLDWLGRDGAAAERQLENMRKRLTCFFRRRGLDADAEDAAQEVLLTLAAKCAAPERPPYDAPEQLMIGIARNITRRSYKQVGREQPLSAIKPPTIRFPRPVFADAAELRCFDASLRRLTDDERATLKEYFASDEWERQGLAAGLGVNATALRVRVHRLKRRLLELIEQCLSAKTEH